MSLDYLGKLKHHFMYPYGRYRRRDLIQEHREMAM
jgi:hypothetical protein